MSVEKEASFVNALKNASKSRLFTMRSAVRRASPYIQQAGNASGFSLHRSLIDTLAKNDAFGAKETVNALNKIDRGLLTADTALGALVRGKSTSGIWHDIWTDKSKYNVHRELKNGRMRIVPGEGKEGKETLIREIDRPSISKPLAGAATLTSGVLAQMKGVELLDKLRSKPQEQ